MVPHRSAAETGLSHVATLRGTLPREPLPDDRPLGLELRQGLWIARACGFQNAAHAADQRQFVARQRLGMIAAAGRLRFSPDQWTA